MTTTSQTNVTEKNCGNCGRVYRTVQDFMSGTERWRVCTAGNLWFNCGCGSTLLLPKGKYEWYSPERAMGESARSVFNVLGRKDRIPRIPNGVAQAQSLLADPNSSAGAIGAALRNDPAISSELVTLANFLKMESGNIITTIEHAIVFAGRQRVSDLLIAAALKTVPLLTKAFTSAAFWRDAIVVGRLTEWLAADLSPKIPGDEAYLAGAMANIGKLIAAITEPETADKIFLDVIDPAQGISWTKGEGKHYGTSHVILGEIAAELWGFPVFIRAAIVGHHVASRKDQLPGLNQMVALANQLSHLVNSNESRGDTNLLAELGRVHGISDQRLDALVVSLRARLATQKQAA